MGTRWCVPSRSGGSGLQRRDPEALPDLLERQLDPRPVVPAGAEVAAARGTTLDGVDDASAQAGRTFIALPWAFFRAARSSSQMVRGLAMYTLE